MPHLPIGDHADRLAGADLGILAPLLVRLAAGSAASQPELLALLPLGDANTALMAALDEGRELDAGRRGRLFAGIFAVDPFVDWERFADDLRLRGVDAVAALPSLAPISGRYAANLAEVELGFGQEVTRLGWFAQRGFTTCGMACEAGQAQRLRDAGCSLLLLHPGPLPPEARAGAAARMAALLAEVPRPPLGRFLFNPAGLATMPDAMAAADGHVVLLPPSPSASRR